jgi:quinol-cytochrome oxidoreductase complex cytochrome b subunit
LEFVWGRAFCGIRTVNRFLSLHIVLPLFVMGVIVLHLVMLHGVVSGVGRRNGSQMLFTSLLVKDGLNIVFLVVLFTLIVFIPNYFMDAENWNDYNPMVTPEHIKPEWYFLFAYGVLRCVPSKSWRLVFFGCSIIIFVVRFLIEVPLGYIGGVIILTWLGGLDILE